MKGDRMNRKRRRQLFGIGYALGYALCAVVIVMCVAVIIGDIKDKKREHAEYESMIQMESIKSEEKRISAMPCVSPSEFQVWFETYAEEDTVTESESETAEATEAVIVIEESKEALPDAEPITTEPSEVGTEDRVWYVNGEMVDQTISNALEDALERHGVGYWIEGALAQCYQESHMQQYAVSKDGKDHGILQYRAQYWYETSRQYGHDGADIYDISVQFDIYAAQMAKRFGSGMSVADAVSRHKTSDWGGYDEAYWNQVSRWFSTVEAR